MQSIYTQSSRDIASMGLTKCSQDDNIASLTSSKIPRMRYQNRASYIALRFGLKFFLHLQRTCQKIPRQRQFWYRSHLTKKSPFAQLHNSVCNKWPALGGGIINRSAVWLKICLTPPMNEPEKPETAAILIQKPTNKTVTVCSITYVCLQ